MHIITQMSYNFTYAYEIENERNTIKVQTSNASDAKFERNERYFIVGNKENKHHEHFAVDIVTSLHKEKPFSSCQVVAKSPDEIGYILSALNNRGIFASVPVGGISVQPDAMIIMLNMMDTESIKIGLNSMLKHNATLIAIETQYQFPMLLQMRQFRYIALNNRIDILSLNQIYQHVLGMFPTYSILRQVLKKPTEKSAKYFMTFDTSGKSEFLDDIAKCYWINTNDKHVVRNCVNTSETESDDESTCSSRTDMSIESTSHNAEKPKFNVRASSTIPFDRYELENHPKPPSFLVSAPISSPTTWTLVTNILAKLQETTNFKEFYVCVHNGFVHEISAQFANCDKYSGIIQSHEISQITDKALTGRKKQAEQTTAIIFVNALEDTNQSFREVLYNGRHYGISGIYVEDFPICSKEIIANFDYLLFNIFSSAKLLVEMSNKYNVKIIDELAIVGDSHVFAMCRGFERGCDIRVNYVRTNAKYTLRQPTAKSAEIRNLKKSIEKYKKELAKKRRLLGENDSDSSGSEL